MDFKKLITSEEARLIFGKKEQGIIKKQLQGQTLTQPERNILSRSIRKKLKFISKLSEFEDEYELKHSVENKIIMNTVNDILRYNKEIVAAYLFGSYATGEQRENSDIDIAILLKENFTPKKFYLSKLANKIQKKIGKEIQIVSLNTAGIRLKHQIIKYGKLIFSRKNIFEYESLIMKEYLDFKYYLDIYDLERSRFALT